MLDVMRYRVNLDTLSLKEWNENEEFEFDLIVAKDDVALSKKAS